MSKINFLEQDQLLEVECARHSLRFQDQHLRLKMIMEKPRSTSPQLISVPFTPLCMHFYVLVCHESPELHTLRGHDTLSVGRRGKGEAPQAAKSRSMIILAGDPDTARTLRTEERHRQADNGCLDHLLRHLASLQGAATEAGGVRDSESCRSCG